MGDRAAMYGFPPARMRDRMAAYYLGVSKTELWRNAGTTYPPPVKDGRSTFWLRKDLDAYLDSKHPSAAQWKRRLHWRLKDGSDLSRFPGFVCEMWLAHDILWFSGSKSLIHRMSLATMEWSDGSLVRRPDRAWRRGAPRPGRSHARPYHAAADGVARAHDPALR